MGPPCRSRKKKTGRAPELAKLVAHRPKLYRQNKENHTNKPNQREREKPATRLGQKKIITDSSDSCKRQKLYKVVPLFNHFYFYF